MNFSNFFIRFFSSVYFLYSSAYEMSIIEAFSLISDIFIYEFYFSKKPSN